jgi:hypothetical protein
MHRLKLKSFVVKYLTLCNIASIFSPVFFVYYVKQARSFCDFFCRFLIPDTVRFVKYLSLCF